ncbi:hypothetical protein AMTRI_Chr03g50180 [Amborella trichopoda]|uniref:AB hydrolase-1 domain-containing protein n=1 Tax=Amborella trichopoda TaxID=13333 RepID=W1NH12_AMBTC|nr:epoxide hydrolase 3 [Amborella trichopoda]ERM94741.1 hypothetical protein AMTR_s00011p00254080 [Amborella trichopoda]|eukprot:XP_006878596.1 epoxide hydrolase 3 [Amborella trichopoda]
MVNLVAAQKPLLHGLMKLAGLTPQNVEIEEGTAMNFWVPSPKSKKNNKHKGNVVLIHGFAAEGIVTWQFQVGSLTKKFSVYVPDLLFFGGSVTSSSDRSPSFQAHCLAKALNKLGAQKCALVGFSYGGMVAFKMAELYPEMVSHLVISGSILAMTDTISGETMARLGFSSSTELLLPTNVKGLKALLSVATHKNLWFPNCLYRDYLKVMFTNREQRAELLDALIESNKDTTIPNFTQKIHLLWGEKDQIFNLEVAKNMREELGKKATFEGIKKAGHLVHLERPCVYNRLLNRFLDTSFPQNNDHHHQH